MAAQSIVESFRAAGPEGRRDYRCRVCGYGIVTLDLPPEGCPMCRTAGWESTAAGSGSNASRSAEIAGSYGRTR